MTGRPSVEEGRHYAYRERAHTPGDPVRPVELGKDGPPRSQKAGLYRAAGFEEVAPFNDEPHAHHWFEKTLS